MCISTKIEVKEDMPRGDRTGPGGLGPLTGRAAGYCAGYPVPGVMNPIRGYGRRGGRGVGRGWRGYPTVPTRDLSDYLVYPLPQSPEQEVAALENYQKELQAEKIDLEQEMKKIKSRIEELKATPPEETAPES